METEDEVDALRKLVAERHGVQVDQVQISITL
jgi:hypothetical protein